MSLMGYDFFIPDMIPGRVQTLVSTMPIPTDELMVRWVEASAFMPVMQFSYFPWNYEEQTARICLQYANVHKALGSYLYRYTRNRTVPIIRPLWFDSPDEKELYSVDDEFLLGHDILVAPVLEPGRTIRNVILPPGKWYDCWTGKVCSGTMLNHPAPCPGIPVFVRTYNRRLFELLHSNLKEIRCGTIQSGVTSASYQAGIDRDLNITG
jgi:alpha-glucosidase (family GH31 glycosyl hydrolase)